MAKNDTWPLNSAFLDRRCKLIDCQKEMMRWWWNNGENYTELAARFKISRHQVRYIIHPELLADKKQYREKYKGKYMVDKVTETRRYKQEEFLNKINK
jgi:hypothetical protein